MAPPRDGSLRPSPALVTAAVLLLAACGGDVAGPLEEGRSRVTVSGAVSETLVAQARVADGRCILPDDRTSVPLHVVELWRTEESAGPVRNIHFRWLGGRPEPGDYRIDPNDCGFPEGSAFGEVQAVLPGPDTVSFEGTAGTLTVTASGTDRLEGSFRFTAAEVDRNGREVESGRSLTVEGEFRAR